jgi:TonB family protein
MRRRIFNSFALVLVLAAVAFAQGGGTSWIDVAPEGEEFVVQMPGPPFRVRRSLPFGEGLRLIPRSYEAEGGSNVRFSVLSFDKSGATPDTLGGLIEGLRHALLGAENGDYLIEHERDLTLGRHAGKQFSLRAGKPLGTVRVYEAARNYYVLMVVGGMAGEPAADHFFSSFTIDPQSRASAPAEAHRRVKYPGREGPPASLWGHIPEAKSVGIVTGDSAAPAARPSNSGEPISGGVLNGKIVSSVPPAYPAIARAARASGTVVVQVVVNEEGRVISARAVTGHPLLQQSAVDAVRQWRFSPVHLSGQPVKFSGTVNVNFVWK